MSKTDNYSQYDNSLNESNTNLTGLDNSTNNYEMVSDYYSNSESDSDTNSTIEEFRGFSSRNTQARSTNSPTRMSRNTPMSTSRNMQMRINSSSGIKTNSKPSFLQQNSPRSSKQYSKQNNPFQIDYKGGSLTSNKINIPSNKINIPSNKIMPRTSVILPGQNSKNQYGIDKKTKSNISTNIGTSIGAGVGSRIFTKYNRDKNVYNVDGVKNDRINEIDQRNKENKEYKKDNKNLVLPSNIQATYDDILAHTKNKVENNRWNNYENYSNRYNKWKNKYYWNRGWKYRTGYWDNGYWNDGYWYYNPYLFYSYLGYPYPYPNSEYYYLEYPYLDSPITNIDQTRLNEIENKIDDMNNMNNENNSEEFNKFLLDELVRLKTKLSELEKYKQEKETVIKDELNLEKNLVNQVKSEIQNLYNLEDISEEIKKFLHIKIKEETEKTKNNKTDEKVLLENFSCRVSMGLPYIILILLILLVFILRK